jgi:hypothetical protein
MSLIPAQQEKLTEWVARKGVTQRCPACGSSSGWTQGDVVGSYEVTPGGLRISADSVTPTVQLICNSCAYVLHFAAVPIGLYEPRAYK